MIEIVQTNAAQPFHVRLRADGNHESILVTENYTDERTAVEAVELLGRMFSPCDKAKFKRDSLYLHVWLDAGDDKGGVFVPVRIVDERDRLAP